MHMFEVFIVCSYCFKNTRQILFYIQHFLFFASEIHSRITTESLVGRVLLITMDSEVCSDLTYLFHLVQDLYSLVSESLRLKLCNVFGILSSIILSR
jgi:hypothetical protein